MGPRPYPAVWMGRTGDLLRFALPLMLMLLSSFLDSLLIALRFEYRCVGLVADVET